MKTRRTYFSGLLPAFFLLFSLAGGVLASTPSPPEAVSNQFVNIQDVPTLVDFPTATAFDEYLRERMWDCLREVPEGEESPDCYIGSVAWLREVQIQFSNCLHRIPSDSLHQVVEDQIRWEKLWEHAQNRIGGLPGKTLFEKNESMILIAKDRASKLWNTLNCHRILADRIPESSQLLWIKDLMIEQGCPWPESGELSMEELENKILDSKRSAPHRLFQIMSKLIYSPGSLGQADPERARIFQSMLVKGAFKNNPLGVHDLHELLEELVLLDRACAAGSFDAEKFLQDHEIDESAWLEKPYGLWQLAEAYSKGEFGDPDLGILFNLIVRGASVAFEWKTALKFVYPMFISGKPFEFDLCEYVSSGYGTRFCEHRWDEEQSEELEKHLEEVRARLPAENRDLVDDLFLQASEYFWSRAEHEEGHGGSTTWRQRHMEESVRGRRWGMLEYMREAASGNEPPTPSHSKAGVEVPAEVQGLIELIEKFGEDEWNRVTVKGVKEAQAQFVQFSDAFGRVIKESQSAELGEVWVNWLDDQRLKDIQTTIEMVKRDAER